MQCNTLLHEAYVITIRKPFVAACVCMNMGLLSCYRQMRCDSTIGCETYNNALYSSKLLSYL
jgi:hypothetical protein